MYEGQHVQKAAIRAQNRCVLTKFFKQFILWSKRTGLQEKTLKASQHSYNDIDDADISKHLKDCSSRATYTSLASVDQLLKCLDEKLDKETCSKKHAAGDYSLLADKTTEIADRVVLSIFIRYLNSDTHKVKEEYLGLVEIIGSKCADSVKKFVNYYT